jgi:uncharacterized protein (UPF0128 family)
LVSGREREREREITDEKWAYWIVPGKSYGKNTYFFVLETEKLVQFSFCERKGK